MADLVSYVSRIDEIFQVNKFLDDESVEDALNDLVKLTVKPEIPDAVVRKLIVKLSALSGTFAMRATYYSTLSKGKTGSDEFNKKQIYYTLAKVFEDLVGALKYMAKSGLMY